MPTFELLTSPKTILGEGPIWDVAEQRIYWVDSVGGAVFSARADGSDVRVWPLPTMVGAAVLRESGGMLVSLADGFATLDLETGEATPLINPEPSLPTRLNDGKTDRQGRFVTGSMDFRLIDPATIWLDGRVQAGGSLYRVDGDLSVHSLKGDVGITNGPCFSPDGKTFYLSDSWRDAIFAYDYDCDLGTISNERMLVDISSDKGKTQQGQVDGCTVDSEGCLWSVIVYTGELRRYTPAGDLDRRIHLPVVKATSCAFGGPDMDILFVTSMANPDLPLKLPTEGPLAGSLIAVHGLGVTGIPEMRFSG